MLRLATVTSTPKPVTAYLVPVNLDLGGKYYPAESTFRNGTVDIPISLNYLASAYVPLPMVAEAGRSRKLID